MHDITMSTKDSPRQCVAKKLGGGIEFDTGLIGKNPLETMGRAFIFKWKLPL